MKTLSGILILIQLSLFAGNSIAQLQRLSITSQGIVKISKNHPGNLKTLGIDYYRDAPDKINSLNEPAYNQVYSNGDAIIKIKGNVTDRSFQSLVQSDTPLLLLKPESNQSVLVLLNPDNPESKSIRKIELEFKSHIEIGNIPNDRDVTQANIIFKNWGSSISQDEFWKKAKCLDILEKSKLLTFDRDYTLSNNSMSVFDSLYKKLDFEFCNDITFKTLINNNYLIIDEQGDLHPESADNLKQYFYYTEGINTTKQFNSLWFQYADISKKPKADKGISAKAKSLYYGKTQDLTILDKQNQAIHDTMINGERYVLMVAWKSSSFANYVEKPQNGLAYYKSNDQLFTYPLFLTSAYDIEKWVKVNYRFDQSEAQYKTRLMQLLGLPPSSTNNLFVEFWAKEEDVFRPAIDSSLNYYNMPFRLSDDYLNAFAGFSNGSFSNANIFKEYPFTGLGYTWDYNPENTTHKGVTEFVLKENRKVYMRRTMTTMDYLNTIALHQFRHLPHGK